MSILVTGASSGFGAAICETLINAGYRVIGAARRQAAEATFARRRAG